MPSHRDTSGFTIEAFPKRRRLVSDIGWMSRRRHSMRGLLEVDITEARSAIRRLRRETGKPLSFTTFLVATVARAMHNNREVNACRTRTGRIAFFDDVHVLTMVEVVNTDGTRLPIGHLLEAANTLSLREIEDRIAAFRDSYHEEPVTRLIDILTSLPPFLRRLLFSGTPRNPRFLRKVMGTVVVSSVGMFLPQHAAWALGQANHTVSIWVGSTVERLSSIKGKPTPRTFACLTIDLDHDIIDGAPAARFTQDLVRMIETAALLKE